MDLEVLSLCRLLLDFSVKVNSKGAVFLFLWDYTQTGIEPNKSSRLTHAAWFSALSSSYVTVVTAVNARQQDGKTAARGLGSEWRAVVGLLRLHPLSTYESRTTLALEAVSEQHDDCALVPKHLMNYWTDLNKTYRKDVQLITFPIQDGCHSPLI